MEQPKLLKHLEDLKALQPGDLLKYDGEKLASFEPSTVVATNSAALSWSSYQWAAHEIPLDTVNYQTGNGLALANGRIVVGLGVKHVVVSGRIVVGKNNTNGGTQVGIYVMRGGKRIWGVSSDGFYSHPEDSPTIVDSHVIPRLVAVEPGDTIYITMYDGNATGAARSIDAKSATLNVMAL